MLYIISPSFSSLSFAAILCHSVSNVLSDFAGKPYNPPVYNTLNYTLQVTCENGLAKASGVFQSLWEREDYKNQSTLSFRGIPLCAVVWPVIKAFSTKGAFKLIDRQTRCTLVCECIHETRFNKRQYATDSEFNFSTCVIFCCCQVTRQVGDKTWVLASPIHAPSGSQIERFAAILGPLEAMSHTLFWTDEVTGFQEGQSCDVLCNAVDEPVFNSNGCS